MNINFEKIKASIQSIGNSLIVAGLIASLFKNEVSVFVVATSIIVGVLAIVYTSLNKENCK